MTSPARKAPSTSRNPRPAAKRERRPAKLSRLHRPPEMSLEDWQAGLRRQFGREQDFRMINVGAEPVFSDFEITNPVSKNTYRIEIRGRAAGENFCTCPDFATNSLGTCKHIEFALARLEAKRGGAAALRAGFVPPYSEIRLQYGAQRVVRFRPGRECAPTLARLVARHFSADGALKPESFGKFDAFLSEAAKADPQIRCRDDVLAFVAEVRDAAARRTRIAEAFPQGIRGPVWDKLLKVPLYDYQREGALFAAQAGRCLLGDEMGLGKTVQAIAAAEIFARHLGVERVLIVCPTSLKHQWEREIAKFSGRSAVCIGGMRPAREQLFAGDAFFKITNYDTVHRDLDLIAAWSPDLVILDEAQRIKNWATRAANAVKKIVSPYAVVLTGTPLENRLEELVSIIQFVDRHRLGPTFRFLHDHQNRDPATGRVVGYRNLDSIGRTLAPVLLRRRKSQVLSQLPERLDKHLFVPMTGQQRMHHDENREIVARIVQKWRRYKFLSEADQRRLMIALQNMRMSCDSSYLLDQRSDFGTKADELAALLADMFEQPDVKVVIFSQWLRMHELIAGRLKARGWDHVLFHGGVPGNKRRDLVDRFRDDPKCRAFLSTDSGGVGLNLQFASVVVNMDLPWNPAVLEQRIGRVHRLGQKRPVQVVNFVAQGTIEEGMLATLKFKKDLFAGVLDGGETEVFLGGGRLNKFMETVESAAAAIPAPSGDSPDLAPALGSAPAEAAEAPAAAEEPEAAPGPASPSASAQPEADPWRGLLSSGLALLERLASAAADSAVAAPAAQTTQPAGGDGLPIIRDAKTGKSFLQFPLPPPEVLGPAVRALGAWLEGLRG